MEWKAAEIDKKTIVNSYFSDEEVDYVYKAKIDAFGNSFGGIFIVKKLGEQHHRIAFTTEMGNKVFDFTFERGKFKVNKILNKLDKKILINILKNDFRILIQEEFSIENSFRQKNQNIYETKIDAKKYYYFLSQGKLNKVIRIGKGKEKVEFLFTEISDIIVKKVQIIHKNFDLKIVLKAL
jgi:hypothetical protein